MKSRASLVLMEQLIMVLVFALAAALCLRVFAAADAISEQTARRDEAVQIAQNAAELIQHTGDPERAASLLDSGEYTAEVNRTPSGIPGLGQAEILISYQGEVLFSLTTGWQEVGR